MNNCERVIRGICCNDIDIKAEIRVDFYKIIKDFVDINNQINDVDIRSRYIFDDVIGLINMRFTSKLKGNILQNKIQSYKLNELLYYIGKQIYISEFKIKKSYRKNHNTKNITIKDTFSIPETTLYQNEFKDVISTRERELTLIDQVMTSASFDEFKEQYFDLAIDIVNKWKNNTNHLSEFDIQEYAKDIFSDAVLKLISLIQDKRYVYEAKISSFIYWPMFNKWAKISKELGIKINDELIEDLPEDKKLYFESSLEREELKFFLTDNLANIDEREKQILWMKEAEGYSYQEIKEILNLKEEINYLKQIKLRGKRNLKIQLTEDRRYKELFT